MTLVTLEAVDLFTCPICGDHHYTDKSEFEIYGFKFLQCYKYKTYVIVDDFF